MTPHWHEQNPWRDQIVYVPIERLAECVAGGMISDGIIGLFVGSVVLSLGYSFAAASTRGNNTPAASPAI